jgi:hypothetical protein
MRGLRVRDQRDTNWLPVMRPTGICLTQRGKQGSGLTQAAKQFGGLGCGLVETGRA